MGEEYKEVSIDRIIEPKTEVRSIVTQEGIDELARSIKEKGVLQPILVREKDGQYEIIAGQRRYLAAKAAGVPEIPVRVINVDDDEAVVLALQENLQREEMNHIDIAMALNRIQVEKGLNPPAIAKLIGKTPEYVRQHLMLLNLEQSIQEALVAGKISFGVARELCRCSDPQIRMQLFDQALRYGANADMLYHWRKDLEKQRELRAEIQSRPNLSKEKTPYVEIKDVCDICGQEHDARQTELLKLCPVCAMALKQGLLEQVEKNEQGMETDGERHS